MTAAGWRSAGSGDAPAAESPSRIRKYRQAAFVYLHVGILYEAVVWVLWRQGILPEGRGPAWVWLLMGGAILLLVFWGLWSWRNRWFARAVWLLHSLRLPAVIQGAFFASEAQRIPPDLYLVGLAAVLLNLAFLARAAWDL